MTDKNVDIIWKNVFVLITERICALIGIWHLFYIKGDTLWFFTWYTFLTALGVSAGAHQLWSHKSYHAISIYRYFMSIFFGAAFQGNIYNWVRDHRVHCRHIGTNADPQNYRKGFWFAVWSWKIRRKHPQVLEKGALIDCSDLLDDPVVIHQVFFHYWFVFNLVWVLPIFSPFVLWRDSLLSAVFINFLRIVLIADISLILNYCSSLKNTTTNKGKIVNKCEDSNWMLFNELVISIGGKLGYVQRPIKNASKEDEAKSP